MDRTRFRGLFCLVSAFSAATFADPLVEAASNAGAFGHGSFTDHSNLDVLPALVASAVLALLYVLLRARPLVAPKSFGFVPLLPAIFGAQLAVLYGMETLEQIIVAGHPLGGAIWLGAPSVIGLALQGIACILTSCALARGLDALTRAAIDIVLFVRAICLRMPSVDRSTLHVGVDSPATARLHPLASRTGKRAPPFLFT
jgi:hypothetical protein